MTELTPQTQAQVLDHLGLNPNDVATQALLLVCDRYGLDPLMRHAVLIKGNVYVTRDGLLHVAHQSGAFDGITVDAVEELRDAGDRLKGWSATVSVYRNDMEHPFRYPGRYPASGHLAGQYGAEMAVKCAEVAALRRAFDVAAATLEERYDNPDAEQARATLAAAAKQDVATQLAAVRGKMTPADGQPSDVHRNVAEVEDLELFEEGEHDA